MASLAELQQLRAALVAARANGLRSVRDSTGEEAVYKTDREMAAALAALDSEIATMSRGPRPSVIRFVSPSRASRFAAASRSIRSFQSGVTK